MKDITTLPNNDPGLAESVRRLRWALHENQEQFAQRLRTSMKTVTRYETAGPPRGSALANLARVARAAGQNDLAVLFEGSILSVPKRRESIERGKRMNRAETVDRRDFVQKVLDELYANLGDAWLLEEITNFLERARHGAPILAPLMTGRTSEENRALQLAMWEQYLIEMRLRAGTSAREALQIFAQDFACRNKITESEAMAYAAARFPQLLLQDDPSHGSRKAAETEDERPLGIRRDKK